MEYEYIAVPDDGDEDTPVAAVFGTGDDQDILNVENVTKGLWAQMLEAGTAGKQNPQKRSSVKLPDDIVKADGTTIKAKARSVNKEPYICLFEGQQQVLQLRIAEAGDEEAASRIIGTIMDQYSKGIVAKVALRANKKELVDQLGKDSAKKEKKSRSNLIKRRR